MNMERNDAPPSMSEAINQFTAAIHTAQMWNTIVGSLVGEGNRLRVNPRFTFEILGIRAPFHNGPPSDERADPRAIVPGEMTPDELAATYAARNRAVAELREAAQPVFELCDQLKIDASQIHAYLNDAASFYRRNGGEYNAVLAVVENLNRQAKTVQLDPASKAHLNPTEHSLIANIEVGTASRIPAEKRTLAAAREQRKQKDGRKNKVRPLKPA